MPVYMYGRQKDQGQEYADDMTPEKELGVCGQPVVMTIGQLLPMVSIANFGIGDWMLT